MALTKDDKEFITLNLKPIQIEIIDVKRHLEKINGSVQSQNIKIQQNERDILSNTLSKRFVVKAIAISGGLIAFILGVVQLVGHFIG